MQIEIYVTDDDPEFRKILAKALEKMGHKFFLCENSGELIDALRTSNGPAIVFLDIHMEGQDGISTIERLRSISRRFRLRFVTGADISTAVAASMIATARDIDIGRTLFKPFLLEQFSAALTEDINLLMSPTTIRHLEPDKDRSSGIAHEVDGQNELSSENWTLT